MDSDIRIKRSVLSLFMALVLIFSTQAQISAPAMSSDRENAQSVSIVPFAKQTEKLQESVSVDPAQNVSDASDEIVHNYGSTGDISSPAGRATSFTDDILSSVNDEITVIENDGQKENTEREGVTIVPADVNNVIRDSLPSIISTKIYTFTVDERGVIVYAFNHINKTERDCMWYLTLYEEYSADGSGGNIAYREINRAVYSSIGTTVMSPELGVLPGNYRLAVECISGFSSDKYDLLIGFAGDDSFEIECNNTHSRYTHLPLGKTISGSASSFSDGTADVDWYMFEITEKGYGTTTTSTAADIPPTPSSPRRATP